MSARSEIVNHVHPELRRTVSRVIPICSSLLADIDIVRVRIPRSYGTLCDKCRTVVVCMVGLETREVFLALITGEEQILGVGEDMEVRTHMPCQ